MLEHAQMEETFLFPILDRASDSDVCRDATEEHGRDLPMMNGIKEEIKMLGVMEAESPSYKETLLSISRRLKKLQDHCKEHFAEEETKLLPLLETAEKARRQEGGQPWSQLEWAEKLISSTESAHSQLFPLLMAGLRPDEALQYVDLVCRCLCDDRQVVKMLQSLVSWFEGTLPLSWIRASPFLKC
ncbi:uncharacterized protein A4U43_C04F6880 [Asparagus officinalis]|uniref:Hemerythrin-like domain-containing protein n=2 Tax=Asparagus officinalis TaxID=4686 RepID=A0A5P1F0M9_ASPOF|nr:uncharacterized protein A4U43_C04F6880 [Asparagus officinalis]